MSYIALFLRARPPLRRRCCTVVHTRELIAYRGMGIGTLMSTYDSSVGEELVGLPIGLQVSAPRFLAPDHR